MYSSQMLLYSTSMVMKVMIRIFLLPELVQLPQPQSILEIHALPYMQDMVVISSRMFADRHWYE